jgi:hypothetical protein
MALAVATTVATRVLGTSVEEIAWGRRTFGSEREANGAFSRFSRPFCTSPPFA